MRTTRLVLFAISALVAASGLATQAQSKFNPPRTADGKPDMQGYWTNATYTPFERPAEFKDQTTFTREQAIEYAKRAQERFLSQPDDDAHYDNSIWMTEKGLKGLTTLRTSIVSEPDGKMPPMNAEGRKRGEERAAARRKIDIMASAQNRGISERCIYWGHEGPPLLPTGYNSNLQIYQSPAEFVVIPETNVWVHTDASVTPELGAIFDPFGNAVHTALSFPLVGEDVLITGAGPIGLMAIAVARHAGARKIAITDVSAPRLELARNPRNPDWLCPRVDRSGGRTTAPALQLRLVRRLRRRLPHPLAADASRF